jgi:hypothetical protein
MRSYPATASQTAACSPGSCDNPLGSSGKPAVGRRYPHWFVHTETWVGSRALLTTPARSARTASTSIASFSRPANASTMRSPSYRTRLNRRSTARCTRCRTGVNRAAAAGRFQSWCVPRGLVCREPAGKARFAGRLRHCCTFGLICVVDPGLAVVWWRWGTSNQPRSGNQPRKWDARGWRGGRGKAGEITRSSWLGWPPAGRSDLGRVGTFPGRPPRPTAKGPPTRPSAAPA